MKKKGLDYARRLCGSLGDQDKATFPIDRGYIRTTRRRCESLASRHDFDLAPDTHLVAHYDNQTS